MGEEIDKCEKLKAKSFFEKLGHPFFTVLGVVSIGVGGAYISSYKLVDEWGKINDITTIIVFFLTNALLWLFGGAILYLVSEYIRYEKTKKVESDNSSLRGQLEDKNNDLTKVNGDVATLRLQINVHQENLQSLNGQISDLQNKIAVNWLKQAFKQHEINSTERATIYFELNKEFSLLARYSPNPELNEIHRQKFPLNQGVISHAWRHGSCIENGCPDFEAGEDEYYAYMAKKYHFQLDQLKKFQMKSCCYVAVAIRNVDDHIGVVIFEGIDKNRLTSAKLEELRIYCRRYESHLVEFIRESKALEVAKRMESARTTGNADNEMLSSLSPAGGK